MEIGAKIRDIRENNDKTMEDLANYLNVAKITYNHYETQEKIIPIERLNSVANYFNVSIDYIFGLTSNLKYNNSIDEITTITAGDRLKIFRKENNITQDKLANILNTVRPTITYYEKGRNFISTAFLYTICHKYNISADYLLGKIDNPKYLK